MVSTKENHILLATAVVAAAPKSWMFSSGVSLYPLLFRSYDSSAKDAVMFYAWSFLERFQPHYAG